MAGSASRSSHRQSLKRAIPSPPTTKIPPAPNDDINADPISSSDPDTGSASDGNKSSDQMTYKPARTYGAKAPRAPGRSGGRNRSKAKPATGSVFSTQGSSRSSAPEVGDDFDPVWGESERKKQRTTYTANIHVKALENKKMAEQARTGRGANGKTFTRPNHSSKPTPQDMLNRQFKAPSMIGKPSTPTHAEFKQPSITYSGNKRQSAQREKLRPQPPAEASPPISKFQAPADHVLESMRSRAKNASIASSSPPHSSPLSLPPSSPDLDLMSENINIDRWSLPKTSSTYEDPGRCPMCRTPVEPSLLESWTGSGTRMSVRTQMKFCTHHKRLEAEQEYRAQGYPDINWETLPSRFESHRSHLVDILTGAHPSHFRDQVASRAARGAGRAPGSKLIGGVDEQELEASSPGYYGSRGRQVMEGWIMREMVDEIRTRAGEDRLIGRKGVSGFVQVVLVPELATLLVMEDMEAEEGRAREVLAESVVFGDLLHKAIEDRIERPEDEEELEEPEDEDDDDEEEDDDDENDDGEVSDG